MKTFKIIDIAVQIMFIIGGIIYAISGIGKPGMSPIHGYIVVGSWQIISYGIHHFFFTPTIFQHDRITYGKMVLAILLLGCVLFIPILFGVSITLPFLLIYLVVLLIVAPFLAVFYLVTCLKEYRLMIEKELIHLK